MRAEPRDGADFRLNNSVSANCLHVKFSCTADQSAEVEFWFNGRIYKLLKELRNRFQPGGPVRQPYLTNRPAGWRNRFLGLLKVYEYGL